MRSFGWLYETPEELSRLRGLIEEGLASGISEGEPEDIIEQIIADWPARRA